MRIAILVPMMSGRGGTESAISWLVKGLKEYGDETLIYFFGGMPSDASWTKDVRCKALGSREDNRLHRFWKYSAGLAQELRAMKPDVVIALDGPRLLKGWLALRLARSKASLWSWIHFPLERIALRPALKLADGHLAISEGVASQLRKILPAKKANRVVTIYNAIDVDVERTPRPKATAVFLHIGRLEFEGQKRVSDLLAAAATLRGYFVLTVIGGGPDSGLLQHQAQALGLGERVEWRGWKMRPWAEVREASALVLTSSFEGFAIVLAEALARGVACISSDCKYGPAEVLEEGRRGWLYPPGDVTRLAQLMQAIIDDRTILPDPDALEISARRFSARAVAGRARRAFEGAKENL
jgi:UDP-D-galactose:(glucosyl)LPS alpha-1,6-D-galactosyltransferase